ncbi:type I restriction enzyme HsdR N-terminal domain-containing protein [Nostocaceae cyanobacterium CENA357]|uniref:Type I restriction enzyme HsdR N-terminal domain-containing protein n=1 Tax=Atlanticothrix silvestris CENA357 TaxID=1725252 RepID=A0A8J7HAW3_9CYAN|nr:type I restriction enzyme HsdR N-terminal domain-containing protein [Atlanticothrix silvestris]MBH8552359.1 type I restriction enzyme HsdR N-terminal domain-containing protein [Atlanticothrix silvestris CENA357]
MSISEQIQQFTKWIQTFDNRILKSEYDVEQKFIMPMFKYLGYPDKYRCNKHPLKIYDPVKQEKKLEITQFYFATDNITKQNADTCLIIVICLDPQATNFQGAIEQAKFYDNYLNPLFFIITNGYKVNVFRRITYHQEELVIDINADLLINNEIASKFYNQLSFSFVKNIDKKTANILAHSRFSITGKALVYHPELQDILAKANFEPSTKREINRLTVVRPKVLIECNLPKAFEEGNCQIQFSSITLRSLKISLNHQCILGSLITGLQTQASWGCRSFFKQLDKSNFEVYLGQTTVVLSDVETTDLCFCIDTVCQEYKNSIVEFENYLETWDFEFVEFSGVRGFILLSVNSKLWELMQRFANEFNYAQGKSEWHIFHQENISIRIGRGIYDHAYILPQINPKFSLLPHELINIVYEINNAHSQFSEREEITSWPQCIGTRGIWTAKYTQQWLLSKYIPKVFEYYSQKFKLSEAELLQNIANYQSDRTPLKDISDIKELIPYLQDIQSWLNMYIENIAALILRSYYRAFTNLVRNTDSSLVGIDYILGNLHRINWENTPDELFSNSRDWKNWNFKDAMQCLNQQVARINNCEYENSFKADLMTRIFVWIIENGKIRFSQAQLNAAKQALLPLWELSRFETRHVYPHR